MRLDGGNDPDQDVADRGEDLRQQHQPLTPVYLAQQLQDDEDDRQDFSDSHLSMSSLFYFTVLAVTDNTAGAGMIHAAAPHLPG